MDKSNEERSKVNSNNSKYEEEEDQNNISSDELVKSYDNIIQRPAIYDGESISDFNVRLIDFIESTCDDLISDQIKLGSIAWIVSEYNRNKKQSNLIKMIWSFLCVLAVSKVSTQETKMNSINFFILISKSFNDTCSNISGNSFLVKNFLDNFHDKKLPEEFIEFVNQIKSKSASQTFIKTYCSDKDTNAISPEDINIGFFGFTIKKTFYEIRSYINKTMNKYWIPKDNWGSISGFNEEIFLIRLRISLWFDEATDRAYVNIRHRESEFIKKQKIEKNNKKNIESEYQSLYSTDYEKEAAMVSQRNKVLGKLTLHWFPDAWLTFVLIGYGSLLLSNGSPIDSLQSLPKSTPIILNNFSSTDSDITVSHDLEHSPDKPKLVNKKSKREHKDNKRKFEDNTSVIDTDNIAVNTSTEPIKIELGSFSDKSIDKLNQLILHHKELLQLYTDAEDETNCIETRNVLIKLMKKKSEIMIANFGSDFIDLS